MDNTCVIINFLTVVRSIQKQFSTKAFKDLLENVIYNAKRVSSPTMIHFVFDSYIELTIKGSETLKRGLHATYEFADIYPCTALPSMMDSFWQSDSNKRKLTQPAFTCSKLTIEILEQGVNWGPSPTLNTKLIYWTILEKAKSLITT